MVPCLFLLKASPLIESSISSGHRSRIDCRLIPIILLSHSVVCEGLVDEVIETHPPPPSPTPTHPTLHTPPTGTCSISCYNSLSPVIDWKRLDEDVKTYTCVCVHTHTFNKWDDLPIKKWSWSHLPKLALKKMIKRDQRPQFKTWNAESARWMHKGYILKPWQRDSEATREVRCLSPSLMTQVWSQGPTWCKGKSNSRKLSSDLRTFNTLQWRLILCNANLII